MKFDAARLSPHSHRTVAKPSRTLRKRAINALTAASQRLGRDHAAGGYPPVLLKKHRTKTNTCMECNKRDFDFTLSLLCHTLLSVPGRKDQIVTHRARVARPIPFTDSDRKSTRLNSSHLGI